MVVAHELHCSATCGILPDQGLHPCLLHQQVDSLALSPTEQVDSLAGKPSGFFLTSIHCRILQIRIFMDSILMQLDLETSGLSIFILFVIAFLNF